MVARLVLNSTPLTDALPLPKAVIVPKTPVTPVPPAPLVPPPQLASANKVPNKRVPNSEVFMMIGPFVCGVSVKT
jgi:hypothetical protein